MTSIAFRVAGDSQCSGKQVIPTPRSITISGTSTRTSRSVKAGSAKLFSEIKLSNPLCAISSGTAAYALISIRTSGARQRNFICCTAKVLFPKLYWGIIARIGIIHLADNAHAIHNFSRFLFFSTLLFHHKVEIYFRPHRFYLPPKC